MTPLCSLATVDGANSFLPMSSTHFYLMPIITVQFMWTLCLATASISFHLYSRLVVLCCVVCVVYLFLLLHWYHYDWSLFTFHLSTRLDLFIYCLRTFHASCCNHVTCLVFRLSMSVIVHYTECSVKRNFLRCQICAFIYVFVCL